MPQIVTFICFARFFVVSYETSKPCGNKSVKPMTMNAKLVPCSDELCLGEDRLSLACLGLLEGSFVGLWVVGRFKGAGHL